MSKEKKLIAAEIHNGHTAKTYIDEDGYACLEVTKPDGQGYRQRVMPGSPQARALTKVLEGFCTLLEAPQRTKR